MLGLRQSQIRLRKMEEQLEDGGTRRQVLQALAGGGGGRGAMAQLANVASRVVKRVLKERSTSGGPRLAFVGGIWPTLQGAYNRGSWSPPVLCTAARRGRLTSLTSALYFRGRWLDRTDIRSDAVQKFCCLDRTCVDVPFVEYDRTRPFAVHDGFKVIKLPYQQGNNERKFSMYIFLPDAHDGLFELAKKFFAEPSFLKQHLLTEKPYVDIKIPMFTVSFQVNMKEFLNEMGLELPFLRFADFTDMVKEDESRIRCIYLTYFIKHFWRLMIRALKKLL